MKPVYLHTLFWALFGLCVVEGLSGCNVAVGNGKGNSASGAVSLAYTLDNSTDAPTTIVPFYSGYLIASATPAFPYTPNPTSFTVANAPFIGKQLSGATTSTTGLEFSGTYPGPGSGSGLQMVYEVKITSLLPSSNYTVQYSDLSFFSNLPANCGTGVGAEQVLVIAGASGTALTNTSNSNAPTFQASVPDITSTTSTMILGNAATLSQICSPTSYFLKSLNSGENHLTVSTDTSGNLWLYFGVNTTYGAVTTIYFTDVKVTLTPATSSSS